MARRWDPALSFPRLLSLPINISGTILLLGGAVWSIGRFAQGREFGYRLWANVSIAGAALLAVLGSRPPGNTTGLYPAEMVTEFLLAVALDRGARRAQGAPGQRRVCGRDATGRRPLADLGDAQGAPKGPQTPVLVTRNLRVATRQRGQKGCKQA